MGRVVEHFGQALGVGHPAAVIRRCCAPAVEDDRGGAVGAGLLDLLEAQRQLPGVPVVVDVLQDVAGFLQGLIETHLCGGFAVLLALLDVPRAEEQLAVRVEGATAEGEPVQMRISPREGGLQCLVDDVESQVRAQFQSAPDRRLGSVQIDSYPQHVHLLPRRPAKLGAIQRHSGPRGEQTEAVGEVAQLAQLGSGDG